MSSRLSLLQLYAFSADQKWLLEFGDYYEKERGIRLFEIWNRIVKLQLKLLTCESPAEFKRIWNETIRQKKEITPFASKVGTLFTLSNAFDNVKSVGFSYLKREYQKQTMLTFLIEIMNMVIDKVEDCYYPFSDRHIYYNATNDSFIRDVAENTNFDWNRLSEKDCRYDSDCDSHQPLELFFDWGARISLMTVSQERNFDFVTNLFVLMPSWTDRYNYLIELGNALRPMPVAFKVPENRIVCNSQLHFYVYYVNDICHIEAEASTPIPRV